MRTSFGSYNHQGATSDPPGQWLASLSLVVAVLLWPSSARAYPDGCSGWQFNGQGHYDNTQQGDIVGLTISGNAISMLRDMMSALGQSYTHVFAISDMAGYYLSQSQFDSNTIRQNSCSSPLNWSDLWNVSPGVTPNTPIDSSTGVYSLGQGTVLEGGVPGTLCSYAPSKPYQLHAYVASGTSQAYNGDCAEYLVDSCGAAGAPRSYSSDQVTSAAGALFQAVFQKCMGTSWGFLAQVFCSGQSGSCTAAANQVVNTILWNNPPCADDFHYNCPNNIHDASALPANPSGILPAAWSITPQTIIEDGRASGKHTHVAHVVPAGYYCPAGSGTFNTCMTTTTIQGEQVGPNNIYALWAGYYDWQCGSDLLRYGYDLNGNCRSANSYGIYANVHVAATGTCSGGNTTNYWAGYYNYYCRYYEYYGYGSDVYMPYCNAAANYAAGCTGCGVCQSRCQNQTCGATDGCGGICQEGSGCKAPTYTMDQNYVPGGIPSNGWAGYNGTRFYLNRAATLVGLRYYAVSGASSPHYINLFDDARNYITSATVYGSGGWVEASANIPLAAGYYRVVVYISPNDTAEAKDSWHPGTSGPIQYDSGWWGYNQIPEYQSVNNFYVDVRVK